MSLFSITAKASGWKALISSLRCVGDEASFKITNDGLEFYCMDASHVSVISMVWEKENMNELTLDAEDKIIGFRTDDLDKIFKRFAADDIVRISQENNNPNLYITSKSKKFDVRTLNVSGTDKRLIPKFDTSVSVSLTPDSLKKSISDVSVFSDENVHFISDGNMMYLESTDQAGKCKSNIDSTSMSISKNADTSYDCTNIMNIISAIVGLCDSVTVSYSTEKPILLEFAITDAGIMRYYLAAKIIGG